VTTLARPFAKETGTENAIRRDKWLT